jgi:hypothetical protein
MKIVKGKPTRIRGGTVAAPAVALDLDELERKARAVVNTRTEFELAQWKSNATDTRRWNAEQRIASAQHIAANSPPVTLALIARIRELESRLARVTRGHGDFYGETRRLLEKGAVCAVPPADDAFASGDAANDEPDGFQ